MIPKIFFYENHPKTIRKNVSKGNIYGLQNQKSKPAKTDNICGLKKEKKVGTPLSQIKLHFSNNFHFTG